MCGHKTTVMMQLSVLVVCDDEKRKLNVVLVIRKRRRNNEYEKTVSLDVEFEPPPSPSPEGDELMLDDLDDHGIVFGKNVGYVLTRESWMRRIGRNV